MSDTVSRQTAINVIADLLERLEKLEDAVDILRHHKRKADGLDSLIVRCNNTAEFLSLLKSGRHFRVVLE